MIDSHGIHQQARFIASPNHDARPETAISLLVIHNISLPPGKYGGCAVIDLFCNQLDEAAHPYFAAIHQLRVSAHFFIRRDGQLLQFVSCLNRAWHAGKSSWRERSNCNDFSIGIELEGCDEEPFEDAQYAALNQLIPILRQTYPITDIAGHSDVAPGRKTDPGPYFDWSRIAKI